MSSYCYQRPHGHTGCENPHNPHNTLPRQPLPLFYDFCLTISPALSVTLKRSSPDPEEEVWIVMAQGLHVLVTQEARNPSAVPHLSVFYATVRKLRFESPGTCAFVLVWVCIIPADTQLEMSTAARAPFSAFSLLAQTTVLTRNNCGCVAARVRAIGPIWLKLTCRHLPLSCQAQFIRDRYGFKVRQENDGRRALTTDQLRKPQHTQEIRK